MPARNLQQQQPNQSDIGWFIGTIPLILCYLMRTHILVCTAVNLMCIDGIHSVKEGYVGLYTQGGRLLDVGNYDSIYGSSFGTWNASLCTVHHEISFGTSERTNRLSYEHSCTKIEIH